MPATPKGMWLMRALLWKGYSIDQNSRLLFLQTGVMPKLVYGFFFFFKYYSWWRTSIYAKIKVRKRWCNFFYWILFPHNYQKEVTIYIKHKNPRSSCGRASAWTVEMNMGGVSCTQFYWHFWNPFLHLPGQSPSRWRSKLESVVLLWPDASWTLSLIID